MLTAPVLVGPLCWPSGWEHHSSVTTLVMERSVQNNSPPSSPVLTHHLHPGMFLSLPEASSRAQGWVWSEQGQSCRANPGSEHRQSPGLASLTCSQVDRQQNREHMCKSQGWGARASARHPRHRHTQSQLFLCVSQLRPLAANPLPFPPSSHQGQYWQHSPFYGFLWYQYTIVYVTLKIRSSASVLHLKL